MQLSAVQLSWQKRPLDHLCWFVNNFCSIGAIQGIKAKVVPKFIHYFFTKVLNLVKLPDMPRPDFYIYGLGNPAPELGTCAFPSMYVIHYMSQNMVDVDWKTVWNFAATNASSFIQDLWQWPSFQGYWKKGTTILLHWNYYLTVVPQKEQTNLL